MSLGWKLLTIVLSHPHQNWRCHLPIPQSQCFFKTEIGAREARELLSLGYRSHPRTNGTKINTKASKKTIPTSYHHGSPHFCVWCSFFFWLDTFPFSMLICNHQRIRWWVDSGGLISSPLASPTLVALQQPAQVLGELSDNREVFLSFLRHSFGLFEKLRMVGHRHK